MRTENENKILVETREEKDIGVWITNDLKHEKQVIAASQRDPCILTLIFMFFQAQKSTKIDHNKRQ